MFMHDPTAPAARNSRRRQSRRPEIRRVVSSLLFGTKETFEANIRRPRRAEPAPGQCGLVLPALCPLQRLTASHRRDLLFRRAAIASAPPPRQFCGNYFSPTAPLSTVPSTRNIRTGATSASWAWQLVHPASVHEPSFEVNGTVGDPKICDCSSRTADSLGSRPGNRKCSRNFAQQAGHKKSTKIADVVLENPAG